MHDAVDERGCAGSVREDGRPVAKGKIGSEHETLLFVTTRDDLEEQVRVARVVREVADLVKLCGAPHNSTHVERLLKCSRRTDDLIHGTQEGRFFHGYYGNYCYLPLYIFAGDFLFCATLRKSDIDASKGSIKGLQRIIERIRKRWPKTRLVLLADSGFARDEIMSWAEENDFDFIFGLAQNSRLRELIRDELETVKLEAEKTGKPARMFRELRYRTLDSWSRHDEARV